MGRRGPQKTPTAILDRRGSWRAKARKNEPKPKSGRPRWPKQLKGMAQAEAEWNRILPLLEAMGVLATADRALLVAYCVAWQNFCEAASDVQLSGPTSRTSNGNLVTNPNFSALCKCADQMQRLGREFGLSPASRAGVTATDRNDVDEAKARFFRPA